MKGPGHHEISKKKTHRQKSNRVTTDMSFGVTSVAIVPHFSLSLSHSFSGVRSWSIGHAGCHFGRAVTLCKAKPFLLFVRLTILNFRMSESQMAAGFPRSEDPATEDIPER